MKTFREYLNEGELDKWTKNAVEKIKDAITDGELDEDDVNSKNIKDIVKKSFIGVKFSDKEMEQITNKVKKIMKIK